MSLSEVCVQQHQHEQNNLKRLLLWGLLASLGAHGIALTLGRFDLWQEPPEQLTPIELIVAQPPSKPEPDAPQPAELSTQTNDPAAATASAPPRAAQVAAAAIVTPPAEPRAPVHPQPVAETQVESAFEEHQPAVEPDAEATEATDASSETMRDLLQRLRGSQSGSGTSTLAGPSRSATTSGGTVPDASAGTSRGVAAGHSATNGRGQGQGSRTVACDNCVRPSYPQSALAAGVEGQPKVSVDINPDGSVRSVTLTRSSGNAAIDQAAIQAARRSRFQPVAGGASVPIEYDLSIEGSRRNRDARRRRERQAVEVPPEPSPTPETAGAPPAEAAPAPATPSGRDAEASPASPAVPATTTTPTASPEPIGPAPPVPEPAPAPAPEPAPAAPSLNTPAPAPDPPPSADEPPQ